MAESTSILEDLDEEECYLYALLMDESGLDLAEFSWYDAEAEQGCWRAWPFQWAWFRDNSPLQIDQAGRSVGKSLSIKMRAFAFPFLHSGQEMVVTAPELVHLNPIVSRIEDLFLSTRIGREMLPKGRNHGITHRPFEMHFLNGTQIVGRIPQRDGRGMKGVHPLWLEIDECFPAGTLVLTKTGWVEIQDIQVGEEVLTHKKRWKRVTQVFNRGMREAVRVVGQGHPGLTTTSNHPFYAQRGVHWRKGGGRWEWIPAHDLRDCYWASPLTMPPLPIPTIPLSVSGKRRPVDVNTNEFLALLGWWIAEGSVSSASVGGPLNRVWWSVTPDEAQVLLKLLEAVGLKGIVNSIHTSDKCVNVLVNHSPLARWLVRECGKGAHNKTIPLWIHGLSADRRQVVLDAIRAGDGFDDPDARYAVGRWKVTTVSKRLAYGIRLLAQQQGYFVSVYWNDLSARTTIIRGKKVESLGFYQIVGNWKGQGFAEDGMRLSKVRRIEETTPREMFDLEVEEDHSFVAEGVVVHNSQDFPDPGWIEVIETLKRGSVGAVWRAHGVTKGVRDYFYKFTQPESGWRVHRITAMHRPTWSDEERQEKIEMYGSRDHPDYRRNILGLHGDASNPLFVLHRLMKNIDNDQASDYNQEVYQSIRINGELIEELGGDVIGLLDFHAKHKMETKVFWIGMDVGYCASDDTEILTQRGWLTSKEVKIGDKSLGINPKTGQSEWQDVTNIYREHFDAIPMTAMRGQSFDALVTPHHKWLVKSESGSWRWKQTRTLNTKDCVPLSVQRSDLPLVSVYSNEFVELVAWFWTEGWWTSKTSAGVAQSWTVNWDYVERIRKLLKGLCGEPGPAYATGTRRVVSQWTEDHCENGATNFRFRGPVVQALRQVVDAKKVPVPGFLTSLTAEQLAIFIETSIDADGWRTQAGHRKIEQRSEQAIRSFEMACALAGLSTSTSYDSGRDRYHLSILKATSVRPMKAAQFPRQSDQAMKVENVAYHGTIWCPTVTHGNWLARRNGSVYFTGNTNHPSEILVFGEIVTRGKPSVFKLFTRIHMERVAHGDQVRAILHCINWYQPKAFSMDKTGLGLPLFQDIQERSPEHAKIIKGYNFASKIFIGFDNTVEVDEFHGDDVKDAGIEKNVLEYASDCLRDHIDTERIWLPWDRDLIGEFQGQTYTVIRDTMNLYGKKEFSKGKFHALDAARMAILGKVQTPIEEFMANRVQKFQPVEDIFIGEW